MVSKMLAILFKMVFQLSRGPAFFFPSGLFFFPLGAFFFPSQGGRARAGWGGAGQAPGRPWGGAGASGSLLARREGDARR